MKNQKESSNGVNLGFEQKLRQAADKMRNNMDAAEYKHVVLGLIFLKYISDAFIELYQKLSKTKEADPEDRDEYRAENIFFVPPNGEKGSHLFYFRIRDGKQKGGYVCAD